jgi:hypothetical protein
MLGTEVLLAPETHKKRLCIGLIKHNYSALFCIEIEIEMAWLGKLYIVVKHVTGRV